MNIIQLSCVVKTKMQLTHLTLLLTITLAPSLCQKLSPNAMTSLLQGVMAPKNAEQAIQILSSVANKKMDIPNIPSMINRRYAIADNMLRNVVEKKSPNRIAYVVQNPKEMAMKKNVLVNSNNVIVQKRNQMPKNVIVQRRTETVVPKKVIIQNGVKTTVPKQVIVRKDNVPKRVIVQNKDFSLRPQMRTAEVMSQPRVTEYVTVPQKKVLVVNESPFLPAASPVSAPPLSSGLPSPLPQSRGQFLRKIPIPPPTI